jgi:hypothetical protein
MPKPSVSAAPFERSDRAIIDAIRRLLKEAVEASSLREVAAEVGISHAGLWNILRGTVPNSRTIPDLWAWYTERATPLAAGKGEPTSPRGAVDTLVSELPEVIRARARLQVARAAARTYDGWRVERPSWLRDLLAELESEIDE